MHELMPVKCDAHALIMGVAMEGVGVGGTCPYVRITSIAKITLTHK